MVHAGLVALVVLAGCRIGFDPIESGPDGGVSVVAATLTAEPGTAFTHICEPGQDCSVDCGLAETCLVECNGASICEVSCPPTGCYVTGCRAERSSTCEVTCGTDGLPSHVGTTAGCP